jgi:PAB-dependent poly(A)-specific ribonuclease subunit 3
VTTVCFSPFFVSLSFSQSRPALVVAYTYHATAQTLYDAHIKPRAPTFVHGRVQPTQPHVPERTVWSYIIQIAGAMKAAHDQGLPVRMIDVTKVIVTGRNRLRISSCGLADVLTYNPTSPSRLPGVPIPTEQIQEDLVMFGKLIMALCCTNVAAMSNFGKSLDVVTQHYSADLKNVALFCLSKPGVHKVGRSRFRLS